MSLLFLHEIFKTENERKAAKNAILAGNAGNTRNLILPDIFRVFPERITDPSRISVLRSDRDIDENNTFGLSLYDYCVLYLRNVMGTRSLTDVEVAGISDAIARHDEEQIWNYFYVYRDVETEFAEEVEKERAAFLHEFMTDCTVRSYPNTLKLLSRMESRVYSGMPRGVHKASSYASIYIALVLLGLFCYTRGRWRPGKLRGGILLDDIDNILSGNFSDSKNKNNDTCYLRAYVLRDLFFLLLYHVRNEEFIAHMRLAKADFNYSMSDSGCYSPKDDWQALSSLILNELSGKSDIDVTARCEYMSTELFGDLLSIHARYAALLGHSYCGSGTSGIYGALEALYRRLSGGCDDLTDSVFIEKNLTLNFLDMLYHQYFAPMKKGADTVSSCVMEIQDDVLKSGGSRDLHSALMIRFGPPYYHIRTLHTLVGDPHIYLSWNEKGVVSLLVKAMNIDQGTRRDILDIEKFDILDMCLIQELQKVMSDDEVHDFVKLYRNLNTTSDVKSLFFAFGGYVSPFIRTLGRDKIAMVFYKCGEGVTAVKGNIVTFVVDNDADFAFVREEAKKVGVDIDSNGNGQFVHIVKIDLDVVKTKRESLLVSNGGVIERYEITEDEFYMSALKTTLFACYADCCSYELGLENYDSSPGLSVLTDNTNTKLENGLAAICKNANGLMRTSVYVYEDLYTYKRYDIKFGGKIYNFADSSKYRLRLCDFNTGRRVSNDLASNPFGFHRVVLPFAVTSEQLQVLLTWKEFGALLTNDMLKSVYKEIDALTDAELLQAGRDLFAVRHKGDRSVGRG